MLGQAGYESLSDAHLGRARANRDFDAQGNETTKDYRRLMKIVLDAGFHSWVGIEYEGTRLPEREGVAATLALLERVRREMRYVAGGL